MGNLATRVVVSVIGIIVAATMVYAGGLPLALFLATVSALGANELYRLARQRDVHPIAEAGIPAAAAIPLAVHLTTQGWIESPLAFGGVVFVALIGTAVWTRSPESRPLESVAVTLLGALYCGATLSFGYALRHHKWAVGAIAGTALVFFPLVLTWATDVGAYFIGRWLGGRRLMPGVSPGKTVAGAVGGLLAAMVVGVAYNYGVLRPQAQLALAPWTTLVFAGLVSVAAQVGDLAESLFKRQAGVKDSSQLVPGHGGILDRLDSLFFVLPVAYLILSRLLLAAPR
jgi:phosphatidate cytidylyltransferase